MEIGALLGIALTLYFVFSKQPERDRFSRKTPMPGATSDPIADQTLTILDAIEARPTVAYHEEYHQHDHHAPQPQHCRHCRAANHPYAPTCTACGAPLY